MTDETFENDTPAPSNEAAEPAELAGEPIADTPAPESAAAEQMGPTQSEGVNADGTPVEERPREVIKGIHPELRCEDPECGPEFTELQFFSPEEAIKQKGKIMLFCARSGKKYFAPAPELQAWIAENKIVKTGRGRKEG
jgi:hypothetical protein